MRTRPEQVVFGLALAAGIIVVAGFALSKAMGWVG
jgi:hypothetical protein